jgi:hypothetical protein
MVDANAWMEYINQIMNKMDYDTNSYSVENIVDAAAIYGLDGSAWAWSPNFPELLTRSVTIEGMSDADTKTIDVNEFDCALKAAGGDRNPSEAGIRMGERKYMMVTSVDVPGYEKLTQLSVRGGGGAALMKTKSALVIALYTKDKPTSNPKIVQSNGGCSEQVEAMAKYLSDQGY